ncbi:MAG: hypothetical protein ACE5H4_09315 [Candidatus Thorarchaeota archaeon]
MQVRIGDYGGKLFTVVHCEKPECKVESEWAKPLNREFQKLTNFDWSDRSDNIILRVTGLGAILMMLFELFFIITMIWAQYFTPWGRADPSPIQFMFLRGDLTVILSILGNVMSAIILQTSLQVYVHDRQLASGAFLLVFLMVEVVFLLFRGLFFNLLSFPEPWLVPFLLISFGVATLLIFSGSLAATVVGMKKRGQVEDAKIRLGLK